jgi:serine phosphatase RsbU (regulator of sigma subunit)
MKDAARRFARRIILFHVLLLLAVLAVVALAVRHIYLNAREQVKVEAEDRQQLLVNQTATGIQSYYKSIQDDMDLIYRAEQEQASTATSTTAPAVTLQEKRTDDSVVRNQPFIRRVIWKQLEQRVSLMFSYEPSQLHRFELRPGGLRLELRGDGRPTPRPDSRSQPRPDSRPDSHATMRASIIGTSDTGLKISDIVNRSHDWLAGMDAPAISQFQIYEGDKGVNLIGIPMKGGDKLVAVVPIAGVEQEYLGHLNNDPQVPTGAWLIDDRATAMAASQQQFVGATVDAISDPQLRDLANDYVAHHGTGTQVVPRSFKFGSYQFGPTMISAAPVTVANTTWELFIATPMSNVDGFVARLLNGAVIWSVIVVVAVTGILASTALQMIRSRLRAERVRHEALTRELSQARNIQLAWLPDRHPASPSIDVAAVNSPASHISGDFYNWFELPDGRLVVVIGDVTGHGMSAAFLMATTQLLVRNTMTRVGDPGLCLEEVNQQLCVQVFNGQFVTMLIAIIDLPAGQFHVATAGHPAPLVADGESFQPLAMEPQLVLGVERDTRYTTEVFALAPQASVLLYTDGVVECPDHSYKRFGADRLRDSIHGRYEQASGMVDHVVSAVDAFRGTRELDDDLTIVAIQLQASGVTTNLTAAAEI